MGTGSRDDCGRISATTEKPRHGMTARLDVKFPVDALDMTVNGGMADAHLRGHHQRHPRPRHQRGLQTFSSSLAYGAPSVFEWELTSNVSTGRGSAFDAVDVAGSLGINPDATFRIILGTDFNPASPFWRSDRSWDVFSVSGTKTGVFGSFELINSGDLTNELDYTPYGSFSYHYPSNSGRLVWTAVPEPSSALVASLCAIGLLRRRRPID